MKGFVELSGLYKIIELIAPRLPYHNYEHLVDVASSCNRYAQMEGVNYQNTLTLVAAGLLHDIFYVIGRKDNEEISAEISNNILSHLGFSQKQIEEVARLIMATKHQGDPQDLLEMIIRDSDLDSLGRDDFFERSEHLRKEWKIDRKEWYIQMQPTYLSQVRYYTKSARERREDKLKKNLEKIRNLKW